MFLKSSKRTNTSSPTNSGKSPVTLSVISRSMHILGNIVQEDGMIDLDGTLDGNVRCTMLTERANGIIKGEVQADTVLIYGRVEGLIKAKQVSLFAGCHIEGIVMHEQLSIEDGAFIDGKLKRVDKKTSDAEDSSESASFEEKPLKMLENIRLIR
ncbi:MAG: polymer-forming cytoskeletal protein [Rickettsiales bacterium]|jgi:cytoskeletal protein CcmA (bactofilin family)|nr:polymer-forming cytoskeletal protein [Rickettsiales bacterium]